MSEIAPRSPAWLHVCGLALLVWGATLATVQHFGSDLPNWDQWDAQARLLYLPHAQGTLESSAFFAPHNEHRIVLTRALLFPLYLLNGQWDARLECVANSLLRVAIVVMVLRWGWRHLDARWQWPFLGLLATFAATPLAWENMIGGFHSQWYFLLGLSLAAIGGLVAAAPYSRIWWVGAACACAALFSMASGVLAAISVGVTIALINRSRADWRTGAATWIVCLLIAALAGSLLHYDSANTTTQVRSPGEFIAALQHNIGWPFERFGWFRRPRMILLPLLAWLPWMWLFARILRDGRRTPPAELTLFAVGLWVLLQLAAAAYARGAGAPWVANRYIDIVVVGILTNVLVFIRLQSGPAGHTTAGHRALLGAVTIGFFVTLAGTAINASHILRIELPQQRDRLARGEAVTRAYLHTGDPSVLVPADIPYPDVDEFIERLSHPEIRAILPESVQPVQGHRGRLSSLAQALTRYGVVIAALGAAFLAVAAWRDLRRSPAPAVAQPPTETES